MRALIFLSLVLANFEAILAWPECGRRGAQNRVVGGHEAGAGEWPWQVYLQHRKEGSTSSFSCGATILSQDWVLTAAHCVFEDRDPTSYTLTVGDHNVKQDDPYQVLHKVDKIILNPGYNRWSNVHDIALMKVAEPMKFDNPAVGPACLPNKGQNNEGQFCYISGWGFTMKSKTDFWDERLQTVGSKIWQFADCQHHWRVRERYQMCFGDGNVGGCMGDSGGPLACERQDGRYAVVGVTSYGDGECTTPGVPSVWTKVSGYMDFIHQYTGL